MSDPTPEEFRKAVATPREFSVRLATRAWMTTSVDVRAIDEAEAQEKAMKQAQNGDVVWDYDQLCDETDISVSDVRS